MKPHDLILVFGKHPGVILAVLKDTYKVAFKHGITNVVSEVAKSDVQPRSGL